MSAAFKSVGQLRLTDAHDDEGKSKGRGRGKGKGKGKPRVGGDGENEEHDDEDDPDTLARNKAETMITLLDSKTSKLDKAAKQYKASKDPMMLGVAKSAEEISGKLSTKRSELREFYYPYKK